MIVDDLKKNQAIAIAILWIINYQFTLKRTTSKTICYMFELRTTLINAQKWFDFSIKINKISLEVLFDILDNDYDRFVASVFRW